jgi:hypothetical protein
LLDITCYRVVNYLPNGNEKADAGKKKPDGENSFCNFIVGCCHIHKVQFNFLIALSIPQHKIVFAALAKIFLAARNPDGPTSSAKRSASLARTPVGRGWRLQTARAQSSSHT